jgi:peroxin-5
MKNAWKPREVNNEVDWKSSEISSEIGDRMASSMPLKDYIFDKNNPYYQSSVSKMSPEALFAKGMLYYKEGHVDEAILAFEGVIQSHPNSSSIRVTNAIEDINDDVQLPGVDEVWNMLGTCHAEMDNDLQAIFCHQQALDYDPFNLSALLALGTSYVNEMNSLEALKCMQEWVKHNPKFHGLEAKLKKEYDINSINDVYSGSRFKSYYYIYIIICFII